MPQSQTHDLVGIGVVERETGIAKETLRMWERRYGAPRTSRSPAGDRLFQQSEIAKLRLVKQLVERGFRPGKLLPEPHHRLLSIAASLSHPGPVGSADDEAARLPVELLTTSRAEDLGDWLRSKLLAHGSRAFVLDVARPLCKQIGDSWECGALALVDEHAVTEQLQMALRHAVNLAPPPPVRAPKVLLTTLPGEAHGLGILMLQALLSTQGVRCVSLGVQTPVSGIISCCETTRFDILALSFSSLFPERRARTELAALRAALAPTTAIWAGGEGIAPLLRRSSPIGISLMTDLEQVFRSIPSGDDILHMADEDPVIAEV